jgi:8-oxo-dGTP diphosphatase
MPSTVAKPYLHVVAAVIHHPRDPSKVFLAQRKAGQHLEHKWEFPGGKLEAGEPRFHGLRREIAEEIGVHIQTAHPLILLRHTYPEKRILLDTWRVTAFQDEPRSLEGQKTTWVDTRKLDEYDLPDADGPIVQALQLPEEILITPDVDPAQSAAFVEQFARVMLRHPFCLVSFRAHGLDDERYAELAATLQTITHAAGGELILHRRSMAAVEQPRFANYRNWHLDSWALHEIQPRGRMAGLKLSASCHDAQDLRQAKAIGCRFAYLSSVRHTASHPGRPAKGWREFGKLARQAGLPVYALGGIKRGDLMAAHYQGATGVAGIRDFWSA